MPKFIKPTVKNKCTNNDCAIKTSDKDFNASIKKMKKVATNYYTEEKLPKNNNEANKVTVQELIKENKIKELKNNNGNKYDYKKSYISIKKVEDEYLLKINLT